MSNNENPNAFKNLINESTIKKYSHALQTLDNSFSSVQWGQNLNTISQLELKNRMLLIASELHRQFPSNKKKSFDIIEKLMKKFKWSSFELWPISEYIGSYGHGYYDRSLELMTLLTEKFTSEFAVRPYLIKTPEKTYHYLLKMTKSSNVHHRRWASEGSRPRLPWGQKLTNAIQNPKLGLLILENLKADPELYVRKSVSNHLNDISKDHPKLVIKTLQSWQKDQLPHFNFIKRQALRTLIKKGDSQALKFMGFSLHESVNIKKFKLTNDSLRMNQNLEFSFEIQNPSQNEIIVNVDYILYLKKSNGNLAPHVFKLKVVNLEPYGVVTINKRHKIKLITTRKYYSGEQKVALLVNGKTEMLKKWELKI